MNDLSVRRRKDLVWDWWGLFLYKISISLTSPIVAAIRPERTGRRSAVTAVIIEIQPNFKVKGQRFSLEELKRLFNELVENSL
ncbi:hypothetical protein H6G97_50655 [Nostoc flagelliforme FACHB-838]|uniref:Uncharacterized protein n=1 Tax=Nostoc flagelliforme FACHB-838 TaxID=2692904 RepID=A0ABR8E7F3_9NOSO|nr:hypothetical protein [Nostoc flagelliforme]MBD2537026.1 hypothetical protein [Nostoc flagelliforme FACHB-838]